MNKKIIGISLTLMSLVLSSCIVNYSFSGASIAPEVKTVSINYFPNNATMVAPILSSTIREQLQDKFTKQTRLMLVSEEGDFNFDGEITNYTSTPSSISANEYATRNRLTITVRVKFTNKFDEKQSYDKSFSAYEDYDSNKLLQEVENTLIPTIVEQIVEDMFNAAASNW